MFQPNPYTPIVNGRYFDKTTDLSELRKSMDSSSANILWPILRRLLMDTKRTLVRYQIVRIAHLSVTDFELDIVIRASYTPYRGDVLDHRLSDFCFTLNQTYPWLPPVKMTVDGIAISHEKYARDTGCFYCMLYASNTWSPQNFLTSRIVEYVAMRRDYIDTIRRRVGREKLLMYRIELPEVIIDDIIEYL